MIDLAALDKTFSQHIFSHTYVHVCVYPESCCLYAELLNISRQSHGVPYEFRASSIQRNNKFLFQLVLWNFTSVFPRNCTPPRPFPPSFVVFSHRFIFPTVELLSRIELIFSIEETFYTRSYSSRRILAPSAYNINSILAYRSIKGTFHPREISLAIRSTTTNATWLNNTYRNIVHR